MSGKGFVREFEGSPVPRPGRKRMLRNLIIGLGNWGSPEAVPVLRRALADRSPLVRAHAVWALRQVATPEADGALAELRSVEEDPLGLGEFDGPDVSSSEI